MHPTQCAAVAYFQATVEYSNYNICHTCCSTSFSLMFNINFSVGLPANDVQGQLPCLSLSLSFPSFKVINPTPERVADSQLRETAVIILECNYAIAFVLQGQQSRVEHTHTLTHTLRHTRVHTARCRRVACLVHNL